MSIQLGVLYILSSHPHGFATLPSINADMRVLNGPEWSRKLREVARHAPPIRLFADGLVDRDSGGWRITDLGRELIASIEASQAAAAVRPALRLVVTDSQPLKVTETDDRLNLAKRA